MTKEQILCKALVDIGIIHYEEKKRGFAWKEGRMAEIAINALWEANHKADKPVIYVLEEIQMEGAVLADSSARTFASFNGAWVFALARLGELQARDGVDFFEDGSKENPHFAVGYTDDSLITLTIHTKELEV